MNTGAGQGEPGFDELLKKPRPANPPVMPENRPRKIKVFVDRDDKHHHEVARLQQSVIMHTTDLHINFQLSVDKIAEFAAQTGLVTEHEVAISMLSKGQYVILLPEGLAPDTFIEAIPEALWDMGLSFQRWSPLLDAKLLNPAYKIILDIYDIPPHLYREKQVVRAFSSFGLYLGSIAREKQEDLSAWTAVVAVEELEHVPYQVSFVTGGLEQEATVKPIMWSRGMVFKKEHMPVLPPIFAKPPPKQVSPIVAQPASLMQDETLNEHIHVSRRVLFDICKGIEVDKIPPELRRVLAGEQQSITCWKPLEEVLAAQTLTPQQLTADPPVLQDQSHQEKSCAASHQTGIEGEHSSTSPIVEQVPKRILQNPERQAEKPLLSGGK